MIPYDLDPSLHTAEPESTMLDDGFSPPQQHETHAPDHAPLEAVLGAPVDPALWAKSAF
jgi:hypothetical protein